jgi:hypothetical protein
LTKNIKSMTKEDEQLIKQIDYEVKQLMYNVENYAKNSNQKYLFNLNRTLERLKLINKTLKI